MELSLPLGCLAFEFLDRDELPIDREGYLSAAIRGSEFSGLAPVAQDFRCLLGDRCFRRFCWSGQPPNSPLDPFEVPHRGLPCSADFGSSAARSNSDSRASISSISMALIACVNTMSAARSRADAGPLWSTRTFSTADTAALDACCSRAVHCPNAARRAFRQASANSGAFIQRSKVLTDTPTALAASSRFR